MNVPRSLALAAALGLTLAAVQTASAQQAPRAGAFERLDTNGDGAIDSTELANARTTRFKRLDENGDGVVSEVEQMRAQDRVRRRAAMMEAMMARQFERLDTNHDHSLSEDELLSAPQPLAARADADKNGVITREEFDQAAEAARTRRRGVN